MRAPSAELIEGGNVERRETAAADGLDRRAARPAGAVQEPRVGESPPSCRRRASARATRALPHVPTNDRARPMMAVCTARLSRGRSDSRTLWMRAASVKRIVLVIVERQPGVEHHHRRPLGQTKHDRLQRASDDCRSAAATPPCRTSPRRTATAARAAPHRARRSAGISCASRETTADGDRARTDGTAGTSATDGAAVRRARRPALGSRDDVADPSTTPPDCFMRSAARPTLRCALRAAYSSGDIRSNSSTAFVVMSAYHDAAPPRVTTTSRSAATR